ncbi:hypothetical protein [Advenella mimigardefordensis]|uniref:Uncharacterized protein n=1 Tax=Advenella mimigardefordensis (strain DSM 17166 / LMG 22922 / DPN7) TaxID=1247726 RepID=W0P8P6_ADVMD|nr:hypothetical protein [Advenella mimigardefordensis]AHG63204.1 hypothetical protein MIM_c11060 [Advenella mimigardefordensis DPN7]
MNQQPLHRIHLIKIRDTTKNEQVGLLLREISRLHKVIRTVQTMAQRAEFDVANGYFDTLEFDHIQALLEPEMVLYGEGLYDPKKARQQHKDENNMRIVENALDVRKNKPKS